MKSDASKQPVTNLDVLADALANGHGNIQFTAPPGPLRLGMLRKALAAIPSRYDDLEVYTEGCDCVGPCSGFEVTSAEDLHLAVIINRRD